VNGRITQLTQPLESGQVVEILTAREGEPSRDWLSPHLGYLGTSRARNKVRQWFKQQDHEQHVGIGKTALDREISRLGAAKPNLETAARRFNFKKPDDLLAAIGRGDVSPLQVAEADGQSGIEKVPAARRPSTPRRPPRKRSDRKQAKVIVEGVEELMTNMARCCKPVPYDPIVGYITRGHGVTVHRGDCAWIEKLDATHQERLINVIWSGQSEEDSYPVDIRVVASDRKGLLRDISSIMTNEEVDVIAVNTRSDPRTDRANMRFTAEVNSMGQLSRILEKIAQLPDVLEVSRKL
jgi:GTP pyrophosphokinase